MTTDLDGLVAKFSAAKVLEQLPAVIDVRLQTPRNPPPEIQQKYVGASFEPAYSEAGRFVGQAATWAASAAKPFDASSRVLDFGAGWGRISRMLLATVPGDHLYAMDVDQGMVALVGSTLPGINCLISNPFPPTVLGEASMTHAFAFSVFSHLSENAHDAWAGEFGRLIAPGGLAFVTVLDELFFNQVAACKREVAAGSPSPFAQSLARMLDDPDESRSRYRSGSFVYCSGGADGARTGDFYGWAVAPRQWMKKSWGAAGFELVQWVPSGVLFEQAMVCLRRVDSRWSRGSSPLVGRARRARRH